MQKIIEFAKMCSRFLIQIMAMLVVGSGVAGLLC